MSTKLDNIVSKMSSSPACVKVTRLQKMFKQLGITEFEKTPFTSDIATEILYIIQKIFEIAVTVFQKEYKLKLSFSVESFKYHKGLIVTVSASGYSQIFRLYHITNDTYLNGSNCIEIINPDDLVSRIKEFTDKFCYKQKKY